MKDGVPSITNFKKQLSLALNMYACIADQLLPSIFYNHHYSPQYQWVFFIYHSLILPEFKISKQWRPGLSAV